MVINTILIKCDKCNFTPFNSTCICNNLAVTYSDNFRVVEIFVDDIDTVSYIQGLVSNGKIQRLMFDKKIHETFVDNYYLTDKDYYYIPYVNRLKNKRAAAGVFNGNLFKYQYKS